MADINAEGNQEDESTIAGRRQPLKDPLILEQAKTASYDWSDPDEEEPRTGNLRVVNETRERLGSDTSALADLPSSSSIPFQGSAGGLAAEQAYRARWRDSLDSKPGNKDAEPMSFHDQTTDILIKIRLLPVMKILQNMMDKEGLSQALAQAEAILRFAKEQEASAAMEGRCYYYIGVAKYLLEDQEALQCFTGALDAKGVFEEGRWAQQWVNHYENVSELSPKRVALSERPISWRAEMFARSGEPEGDALSGKRADHDSLVSKKKGIYVVRESPEPGIPVTTPVTHRFSLDVRDDLDEDKSFTSNSANENANSSIVGGERIPSFSSWGSIQLLSRKAEPDTAERRETVIDIEDLHSPKSTPAQQIEKGGNSDSASMESTQLSPGQSRSKSVSFSPTTMVPDAEKEGTLRHRRRQSSIFNINTAASILKKSLRELSISPIKITTKSTESLMEEGESPSFAPTEKEKTW